MHVEDRHLAIVKKILTRYPYTFYMFGSRVKGTQRELSDLDICFMDDIPLNVRAHIDEDFEESDLPFRVDIIDWRSADAKFKATVEADLLIIQER